MVVRHAGLLALSTMLCALVLAGPIWAEDEARTDKIDTRIGNFTLPAASEKPFQLHDLAGKKAVVVVFLNFECPVSTSYSQELTTLAKTYGERGVAFAGVCPCDPDDRASAARHAAEYKLPFPVYLDEKGTAADALKAAVTPEVFVLDHNFYLRYRGRIDDGYSARLKRNISIKHHDLHDALEELLAGKAVTNKATVAIGCPIVLDRAIKKTGAVTYYRDVQPILQENCQSCHRPGEVGPFSLTNYKQAVNWAGDVKEYTQSRRMPPWKPVAGAGFHNERKLTEKQIATLTAWVDGGTPEGDPQDAPPAKEFPDGWQLGKPDLVLTMSDDFQLGPTGPDVFRCMVLPTGLTEDKYVTAIEMKPGNPRILHHTLIFIDAQGRARELEKKEQARPKKEGSLDGGCGYSAGMGGVGFRADGGLRGWAPGVLPLPTPEGAGYFLPRNSDLVLQMHYHRNGRLEKDRSTVGLHFAKKPVRKRVRSVVLAGGDQLAFLLRIPKNDPAFAIKGTMWAAQDFDLHDVLPHMHMVGKKIQVTMTPPDGEPQTLIAIDDWDYNWQEVYVFKQPIHVKAGTRFDVQAIYDNSSGNPNNPNNPPQVVTFGEQTTNEMCFVFLSATSDRPGRLQSLQPPKRETPKDPGKP